MNKNEFVMSMAYLATAYNKELNESQLSLWYEFFKDIDLNTFKLAIKQIILEEDFMPSISRVNQEILKIKNKYLQLDPDSEWAKVINLIGKYGIDYKDRAYKEMNPYTLKVVNMMGWEFLCQSQVSERKWNEREFKELFNNLNDKALHILNNKALQTIGNKQETNGGLIGNGQ